jgi:hypothetical protein
MAAYQTVNKKAQIFARPTRIINVMDMRRTQKVDTEEVHSRMPTTKLDKTELDRLLNICKE